MKAEQIWDSVMAMMVPDLDQRPGTVRVDRNYELARHLEDKPLTEILTMVDKEMNLEKSIRSTENKVKQIQRRLNSLNRKKRGDQAQELRRELSDMREDLERFRSESMVSKSRTRNPAAQDRRWKGMSAQWVRASELASPAPEGHFLREFGQSDRQTIDASNDEANVPQALMLLNGPILKSLMTGQSELAKALKQSKSPADQLDQLFLHFLTRKPSLEEREWLLSEWHQHRQDALEKVAWMLLNSREFSFVQ